MDGQLSLFDFIPKSASLVRTECLYDKSKPCNILNAHDVARECGTDCQYGCCNDCKNAEECGARCNNIKHSRFTEKNCAATLEKCDCHCGTDSCCQYCTNSCENRCSYSLGLSKVFDRASGNNATGWVLNPDYFNPVWEFIRRGTGFVGGKDRVFKYFTEKHTQAEKVKFLKDEYGQGGFGSPHEGKKNFLHSGDTCGKCVKIEYLDKDGINHEEEISWNEIEKATSFLIKEGWYM